MTGKRRSVGFLALALIVAAIAAPAAFARTEAPSFGISNTPGNPSHYPTQVRVVSVPSNSGFDWGDAAIGAGVAVALAMIAFGGAMVTHSLRHPQTAPSASTPGTS